MITEYFWPDLDVMNLDNMFNMLQQDGATSLAAIVTIDLLKNKFGERVISRNGPVNGPKKPATIDDLRTNIEHEIAAVTVDLCLKTVEN